MQKVTYFEWIKITDFTDGYQNLVVSENYTSR